MIQIGNNITMQGDILQKTDVNYLYHAMRNPKNDILNKIRHLRIIKNIDIRQYKQLKKQLPYFVCGNFNPNIRRTENFAYISYFVIDIDHINEKGLSLKSIREKIENDDRVLISFVSPSEDGLKIMFKLDKKCYDAGVFSLFYKKFLSFFSRQYHLEQVADPRTSDVTRACFLSYDPNIYYNPNANKIKIEAYIDTENVYAMFQDKIKLEKTEKENIQLYKQPKQEVDEAIISQIKNILKTTSIKKENKSIYIPDELNDIMDDLQNYIIQTGVVIKEIRNINYGKKIKAMFGRKEAEVNLFYGKRGFTVVQSPRTGTTLEMNQLLAELIDSFLNNNI